MKRIICLFFLLLVGGPAAAAGIPSATNLAATGSKARSQGKAVLVFYYQEQCHFCDTARKGFLRPMLHSDSYTSRIIMRQVNIEADTPLTDFKGHETTHSQFAARLGTRVTPIVALYGPDGHRLGKPLVGLKGGTAYYGHYLDGAIDEAVQTLSAQR
ncbi:MAG TPA: thioredoxin fold domain-containing protein [Gammaproteobacteria bacterium]|nr:thioredoxin fold domain-containing protein [Gammaproteobacteria bacterium]